MHRAVNFEEDKLTALSYSSVPFFPCVLFFFQGGFIKVFLSGLVQRSPPMSHNG